jgi:uncharacterized membrane protein YqhA
MAGAHDGPVAGSGTVRSAGRGGRHAAPSRSSEQAEATFEWLLSVSRLTILLPVTVLVLSAIGAFVYGTAVFINSLIVVGANPLPVHSKIGLFLIEVDLFLVGATLIIAALGFYELFIRKVQPGPRRFPLPRWLEMRDLNDLKARVISMLILVASVSFLDVELQFHNGVDTLYLGASVALVISALTFFIRFSPHDRGG